MKKIIMTSVLIIMLIVNAAASVIVTKYSEEGTKLQESIISEGKGNEIRVSVQYLSSKKVYFGIMEVTNNKGEVTQYVSYTNDYSFFEKGYFKYRRPIIYNTLKYTAIGSAVAASVLFTGPMGASVGIALKGTAISGAILIPTVAAIGTGITSVAIDNFIQNYKKNKWIKINN